MKSLRHDGDLMRDTPDRFSGDAGRNHFRAVKLFDARLRLWRLFSYLALRIRERVFVTTHTLGDQVVYLFLGDHAFLDQALRIDGAHAWMRFDTRVHQRLRVTRLVSLVVTKPAETDQIEHNVFIEFLAIVERDLQHAIRGLRIVAVDMEDRQLSHARNVS